MNLDTMFFLIVMLTLGWLLACLMVKNRLVELDLWQSASECLPVTGKPVVVDLDEGYSIEALLVYSGEHRVRRWKSLSSGQEYPIRNGDRWRFA